MNIVDAIILGIIEGITEFLPVSSTAHLLFTNEILGIVSSDFTKSFDIIIQFGAILAALCYFGKRIYEDKIVVGKALLGFIPTGIAGFLFYKHIKEALGGGATIAWVLIIGGIVMLMLERYLKRRNESRTQTEESIQDVGVQSGSELGSQESPVSKDVTFLRAFWIGCFQCISLIPGVSRSASTVYGARILGIKEERAIDFSFMLAIPTMAAATGYDLLKNFHTFSIDQLGILSIGFFISFFIAFSTIGTFLAFVKRFSFGTFAWYRIVIGILALLLLF